MSKDVEIKEREEDDCESHKCVTLNTGYILLSLLIFFETKERVSELIVFEMEVVLKIL